MIFSSSQTPYWWIISIAALTTIVSSCTYDFDAAFGGSSFDAPAQDSGVKLETGAAGTSQGGMNQAGASQGGASGVAGSSTGCAWHVPTPPDGWKVGFFLGTDASSPTSYQCSGMTRSFEDASLTLYESPPAVAEGSCTCSCQTPSGGTCTVDRIVVYWNNGCSGNHNSVHGGDCVSTFIPFDLSHYSAIMQVKTLNPPTCLPGSVSYSAGAISWGSPLAGCTVTDDLSKGAETLCLADEGPLPPNANACVFSSTHASCPPDYPIEHHSLYDGNLQDNRSCPDSCDCLFGGSSRCEADLYSYAGNDCDVSGLTGHTTVNDQSCAPLAPLGGPQIHSLSAPQSGRLINATCEPSVAAFQPSGDVTPSAVTICCQE